MQIETYRTRKGFVVFDTADGLYRIHVRRPGSCPPQYFAPEAGETRDEGVAIALLQDWPESEMETRSMTRLALCVGLTRLDATAYDDWDGACPGCDRDAARFAEQCHDRGFDGVTVLLNQAATKPGVASAFKQLADQVEGDDLLVLYNSGHGGQQDDTSGDEEDRRDETLCWYDGEVVDDQIETYLSLLPAGLRVLFVSDTCNSGSNYRAVRRRSTPVRLRKRNVGGFQGRLIHFGGCADGRWSYGRDEGGEWTIALLDAMHRARRPLTYRQWFHRAAARIKSRQRPVLSNWGPGSEVFLDQVALQ